MEVGCLLVSLVLFLVAGFYWLAARRMVRQSKRRLRHVKELLQVSRGNRSARERMRLQRMREKEVGQRNGPLNRYRPAAPNARPQGNQKRKKALIKIYGGSR